MTRSLDHLIVDAGNVGSQPRPAFVHTRGFGWLTSVVAVAVSLGTASCLVRVDDDEEDDDTYIPPPTNTPPPTQTPPNTNPPPLDEDPTTVDIDTGRTIVTTPGGGVGIFVEYAGEGVWHVFTACDTNTSGFACKWDAIITGQEITGLEGENLDSSDELSDNGEQVTFSAETDSTLKGFRFTASPDSVIRLETHLDGNPEKRFTWWYGNGVLHGTEGAVTNPQDFQPIAAEEPETPPES